jgi:hypothetical protein
MKNCNAKGVSDDVLAHGQSLREQQNVDTNSRFDVLLP